MAFKKHPLFWMIGLLIFGLALTACAQSQPEETETTSASETTSTSTCEIVSTFATETSVPSEPAPTVPTHAENSGAYLRKASIRNEFGKAQYSVDEIRSMKDYSAEELQTAISTVADMIQYIIETDYGDNSLFIGNISLFYNNYIWCINKSPEGALLSQSESCGSISNLVRYVLEDDYDEEGYIRWQDCFTDTGNCGGHIMNYFKQGDTYLIFDFSTVIRDSNLYRNSFRYFNDLEDVVPYILAKTKEHPSQKYRVFFAIYAERDVHRDHSPFAAINQNTGKFVFFFDTSYQDEVEILYFDEEWLAGEGSKWYENHPIFQDKGITASMIPAELVDSAYMTQYYIPFTP